MKWVINMALEARICPKCGSKGLVPIEFDKKCFCGGDEKVFPVTEDQYIKMSDYERNQMIEQMGIHPLISKEDALTIYNVTHSTEIIDAMIELKQKDIIEYGLKLSQFKTQLEQQKNSKTQNDTTPRCPHCKSSNIKSISTLNRGASIAMWGVFSKKINKSFECLNCKYTW